MTNLSKIIKGGGVGVPVFTETQLDNELAAGTKNILIEDVITITTPKILATNNVKIISVKEEAGLIDDGNLTAPLFTIDAQNVILSSLNIQCNSEIFNVIDLTANACKCEISNCIIKSDVINVINLHENSSNNIITDNILEQINLSTAFTQKGPEGGIPEVLNNMALGNSRIDTFGLSSDVSANGEIMVVTSYGYRFDHPDENLRDRSFAKVFKLVNNQWEALGQDFIGVSPNDFEFTFGKINAEGTRVVFLSEGSFADITIFDYNETTNLWELNTSTFTNPDSPDPMNPIVTTGIIQDVPAYRAAMNINDQGNIIAALDYDGVVTVYEEINNEWVQKGQAVSESFRGVYHNIKLDNSGNTFLVAKRADTCNNGLASVGGFDVFTYNGNEWVRKGSEIFGLIPFLRLGEENNDSPCGISGDGNVVAIQGEINLKAAILGGSASKGRFIQEYDFKNIDDIVDFQDVLEKLTSNVVFNSNDDAANFVINLVYKYNETLMDWELLDIVTLQSSLNDFLTENALKVENVRRSNFNIGLNYHGNVLCINTASRQVTVYQLNTKTKTYEQSSRLQNLELDFSNFASTAEDFDNEHLALNGLSDNGKHFYASWYGKIVFPSGNINPGFAVVFDIGLKPNILDFGINNELSGNSFEKEKRIQPTKLPRNWNSYSIGVYKNPSDPDPALSTYSPSATRNLSSYDEVLASNSAISFRCPKPEKGARFRIFVMDTVTPYSQFFTNPNAVLIKPFDTEFIINAGVPFDSNSPFGGFRLIPGNAYEFISDGTNWFSTGGYDNSFVDNHLNTNTAVDNQFLSYDTTTQNYIWAAPAELPQIKEIVLVEGIFSQSNGDLSSIEENKTFIINDAVDTNSFFSLQSDIVFNNCDFIINTTFGPSTSGTAFQSFNAQSSTFTFNNCNFIIKEAVRFRDLSSPGLTYKFNSCSFTGKSIDFDRLKQTTLSLEHCKIHCEELRLRGDFYDFTNCDVQVSEDLLCSAATFEELFSDNTLLRSVAINNSNFNIGACRQLGEPRLQITTDLSTLNIKRFTVVSLDSFINIGMQSTISILQLSNDSGVANFPAIKIGANTNTGEKSKLYIGHMPDFSPSIDIISTSGTTLFTMKPQIFDVKFIDTTLVDVSSSFADIIPLLNSDTNASIASEANVILKRKGNLVTAAISLYFKPDPNFPGGSIKEIAIDDLRNIIPSEFIPPNGFDQVFFTKLHTGLQIEDVKLLVGQPGFVNVSGLFTFSLVSGSSFLSTESYQTPSFESSNAGGNGKIVFTYLVN